MNGAVRGALGIALAGGVLFAACSTDGGIPGAAGVLHRDSRFGNGPAAGRAFLDVGNRLLAEARHCQPRHPVGPAEPPCAAVFSGAAEAQATAVAIFTCTAPTVYATRLQWARYLSQLDIYVKDGGRRLSAPRLPAAPAC